MSKRKTPEHRAKMERKRAARAARLENMPARTIAITSTSTPPAPAPPTPRRNRNIILPLLLLAGAT